jgi:hypothetical protein
MLSNESAFCGPLFPLLFQLCVAQKSRDNPASYLHLAAKQSDVHWVTSSAGIAVSNSQVFHNLH